MDTWVSKIKEQFDSLKVEKKETDEEWSERVARRFVDLLEGRLSVEKPSLDDIFGTASDSFETLEQYYDRKK